MSKKVEPIIINETDVIKLRRITDGTTPSGENIVKRAKALLKLADGVRIKDVASELGMRENSITDIRRRYLSAGIDSLFDKPKSGRPVSYDAQALETAIDLRLQQCATDGSPIPPVKELAKELKAPENVVREFLQKRKIVSERGPHYWSFTMADGTVPKLMDLCGLYLSSSEQALVLKAWTIEKGLTIDLDLLTGTNGVVRTKTQEIASRLEALVDESGKIDMADALAAYAATKGHVRLGRQDSSIAFLKDMLPGSLQFSGIEYHVFTCGVSVIENGRSILPDTFLHTFDTQEAWLSQVEKIAANMYSAEQGKRTAVDVRDSIYSFLRTAQPDTEPFQWKKVLKKEPMTDNSMVPDPPMAQDGLSPAPPGTICFTAEFVDDDHRIIKVRTFSSIPMAQEDFDTESRLGYMSSFDKVEQAVVMASRECSRLLSEKYLQELEKKT